MSTPSITTLEVPGAHLHCEVRGTGPLLLLVPGGNGDTAPFERLANELARSYTVASYDRRGFSRSPLDAPPDDRHRLEADRQDVLRLIDHLAAGPAHVFGSSSGAIVALDVIAHHPDRVRTVVAHEPPMVELLPDAATYTKFADDVYATYGRAGLEAAMLEFSAGIGMTLQRPPPGAALPPQVVAMMARMRTNMVFWLEHELRQYIRVVPDVAALKPVANRLVLAGGLASKEQFPYRPNMILAERLGLAVIDFPGDHVGYTAHPVEFAAQLIEVLPG